MATSETHRAHPYVSTAHRAALLYSFATLLLAAFVELSAWSVVVNLLAASAVMFLFVAAIATYVYQLRNQAGDASRRLEAVLETYAFIQHKQHENHGTELAALLHRGAHVARAQRKLNEFIRDLLAESAEAGDIRPDVTPEELAVFCLHALRAAGSLASRAAVRRLVHSHSGRLASAAGNDLPSIRPRGGSSGRAVGCEPSSRGGPSP